MWGAGITHITHMVQQNNFSPSNTGIVVYWDFVLPIILIVLYILDLTFRRRSSPAADRCRLLCCCNGTD